MKQSVECVIGQREKASVFTTIDRNCLRLTLFSGIWLTFECFSGEKAKHSVDRCAGMFRCTDTNTHAHANTKTHTGARPRGIWATKMQHETNNKTRDMKSCGEQEQQNLETDLSHSSSATDMLMVELQQVDKRKFS